MQVIKNTSTDKLTEENRQHVTEIQKLGYRTLTRRCHLEPIVVPIVKDQFPATGKTEGWTTHTGKLGLVALSRYPNHFCIYSRLSGMSIIGASSCIPTLTRGLKMLLALEVLVGPLFDSDGKCLIGTEGFTLDWEAQREQIHGVADALLYDVNVSLAAEDAS